MTEPTHTLKPPASSDAVERLRAEFPNLPADYFSFLLRSDGGEGFLGISPGYFQLWSAHEVSRVSSDYQLDIYLPGYVAVGTSGGGDLYVFPISGRPPGIFIVPAIGMEERHVDLVARSFDSFVHEFGKHWQHD